MLTLHPNQVIAVGLSAFVCLSQLSWADVNIGNQLVKNQAGTSHTITDGNLIQVDGYLRSVEADANGKYTGNGGSVVLAFAHNAIVDGPGDDFVVFENAFFVDGDESQVFAELAEVAISEDGEV